jgi:hypothetical protein
VAVAGEIDARPPATTANAQRPEHAGPGPQVVERPAISVRHQHLVQADASSTPDTTPTLVIMKFSVRK